MTIINRFGNLINYDNVQAIYVRYDSGAEMPYLLTVQSFEVQHTIENFKTEEEVRGVEAAISAAIANGDLIYKIPSEK